MENLLEIEIGVVEEKRKICSKCKIEKLFTDFRVNKSNNDGFNYNCKLCTKNDPTIIESSLKKNRDKILLKKKEYYYKNKEYILKQ